MRRHSIQYIRTRQIKIERMHRRRNKKRPVTRHTRDRRIMNSGIKPPAKPPYEIVALPSDSRFIENIDAINIFIQSVIDKAAIGLDNSQKGFFIDLSNVTKLDEAMINILLTVTNYFGILGYDYIGNVPADESCRNMLEMSGFFNHVETLTHVRSGQDTIFTISGDNQTNDQAIGAEIKKIIKSLTGVEDTYQPLYTTLGEIAANSVEHANVDKDKKNWFMSVHYEQNRVLIMMADIGAGILKTMNLHWLQEFINDIRFESPANILRNMFAGKYQSSTREENRNNGLPDMVPRVRSNFISNIVVVSNDAIYDFSDKLTRSLNNSFPGTFYSIEITAENITTWQNRHK